LWVTSGPPSTREALGGSVTWRDTPQSSRFRMPHDSDRSSGGAGSPAPGAPRGRGRPDTRRIASLPAACPPRRRDAAPPSCAAAARRRSEAEISGRTAACSPHQRSLRNPRQPSPATTRHAAARSPRPAATAPTVLGSCEILRGCAHEGFLEQSANLKRKIKGFAYPHSMPRAGLEPARGLLPKGF
jgi:hypothetical protein